MFTNYVKIAFRNLWKNRVYSGINVFGLAVGLATCLLIALYVADELSYDRHHERANRIYRFVHRTQWDGGDMNVAITSAPYAAALKQMYPEIEQTVRVFREGGGIIQAGQTKLNADDIVFADASLFKVFTHPFLAGDPNTALSKPQSIVLTNDLATRLFGSATNALGKTVLFENNFPNLVTGVIDDVPANSHLTFSAIRSLKADYTSGWQDFTLYTYLLLKADRSGAAPDPAKLSAKFPAFYKRYVKPEMGDVKYTITLQPLTSIHLHSNLDYEIGPNGNSQTVLVFSLIGGLILLLAGINYMNLATARSIIRIREVGVRQAIGSGRSQLAGLFLTETLLLTVVATSVGVLLAYAALPIFNQLTGKSLSIWRFGVGYSLLAVLGFALLTGLLSGTYPAVFLSGSRTVAALRGQLGNQAGTLRFRKLLVTGQFVVTVALIAASGIIYQQLRYTLTKDLGFNKEQVLTVHLHNEQTRTQLPAMKAQLLGSSVINGVAAASNPIGVNSLGSSGYFFEVDGKMTQSTRMTKTLQVDADFLPTMEIKLVQGRNFSEANPADRANAILVNESLVKAIGWQNPLGKRVKFFTKDGPAERRVVGVVRDFHTHSLQHKIEPLALQLPPSPDEQDNLYINVRAGQTRAALALIEKTYRQFEPGSVFDYQFLDQNFAKQYATEQKQSQLLLIFTALAILIACLGLFGLTTFMAEQRTKEIGVRKVLGASVTSIVALLSKDFLKLVLVAIVIASPLANYAMTKWLNTFAYKITPGWDVFALAGILAIGIALITVSFQSIRAALTNPVKSLRSE
ncbi:ABC transporter permease [Fibrella aquatilis]|uniref:ABC transporter permease n=1 Tax=Fibrella aquatilis TaxID=2817059 RepID=A0A939K043_9BACT|nr:ABC transporter permease [Fibrella aquatilis]MBO0930850.1 ABC transporter permease [Fibrella aquatilis]